MFECKCKNQNIKVLIILVIISILLYVAVEICLFVSDQYVIYKYLMEHGLPYGHLLNNSRKKRLSDEDDKKLKLVQAKAAWVESVSNLIRLSFGLATVLIIGYISDHYGRKIALGILIFGEALYIGLIGFIIYLNLNPWTVVFPGLFEGLFGGGLISFTAQISACLADITVQPEDFNENSNTSGLSQQYTSKEYRWLFFTMYDSLASLSHACGSLFGGMVVHRLGFGVSIIICLALYTTSVVGLSILPETNLDVLKRRHNQQNNAICQYSESRYSEDGLLYLEIKKNTFIIKILEIFIKMLKAIQHSSPLSRIVMTLLFSVSVTVLADLQYIYIYLMGCPFFWNAQTVGLYAGVSDALSACLSITFTVAIYNWEQTRILQLCSMGDTKEYVAEYNSMEITSKEIRILFMITTVIFIGFGFMLINKILMGIAFLFTLPTANYIVYGASAVRLVKNTLIAPIRTMISIITPNDKQGFILSLGAFISFVGFLFNLTVFPLIYAGTVHVFPGAVFFMCGILITITIGFGVLLPIRLTRIQKEMILLN
ncbi:unnamed protein product [Schistosoma rodhaini]|uniref:Uncharacterized protein n=1 Tax=Schistosoma rodhaini TaxID=6188 RepID=A0AA85ELC0_9TREM|nr:unnamed protein product [Schistosoma rodhaini]CAH8679384.1 unnamed protein product [Schistosoma rodhaini]